MPCKQISLYVGAPLGNEEGNRFLELFEKKGYYIQVPFLGIKDIKILSLGAIWNFGKGVGLS
jgi:hypothetical protein